MLRRLKENWMHDKKRLRRQKGISKAQGKNSNNQISNFLIAPACRRQGLKV
jgi:hypothetical protein